MSRFYVPLTSNQKPKTANQRSFRIYTLGCKVNQYESQALRELFAAAGFVETDNGAPADACIINTCTVTAKADRKSKQAIRRAITRNPGAAIIATGCLAQNNQDEIRNIEGVHVVIGNEAKQRILSACLSVFKGHDRAFVKIQDGCDNFCSYCKVAIVRGRPRSKPLKLAIKEVKSLADAGFAEIVLTGICLGAYGRDLNNPADLCALIKGMDELGGAFRVRLSSIEPNMLCRRLIETIASSGRLCRHLHIPLQSGDDEILKKMNRRYTSQEFRILIDKIRNKIPDAAITTDVMVGFPGEIEENFGNTVRVFRQIEPSRAHIFAYSPRQGTAACNFRDTVDVKEIKRRGDFLRRLSQEFSQKYNRRFIGAKLICLVESRKDALTGLACGYTDNYIRCLISGSRNHKSSGKLACVKISGANSSFACAEMSER